ncbi:MAG TPA: PQQ-binding-like beta-propeller repeat protein [Vicinamibacterales bacterium]
MKRARRVAFAVAVLAAASHAEFLAPALSRRVLAAPDGQAIYKDHCARCHDAPQARTPGLDALKARSADTILLALTSGSMTMQAQMLSGDEKRAVAEFLGGKPVAEPAASPSGGCSTSAAGFDIATRPQWSGWGNDLSNTRFQPTPGLTAADVPTLTLKWAFGFPGGAQAYSQPTMAGGRVFVGSDNGTVYALDAGSGCATWSFKADAGVRTAVSVGASGGAQATGRPAAYFGDTTAHVYAVDAATGQLLWKKKADDHRFARVTGAPVLYQGRLYVPVSSIEEVMGAKPDYPCCTFRGSVIAYDAATGDEIWKTYTVADAPHEIGKNAAGTAMLRPAGAAVWSSPTIDVAKNALYIGTGNSYTEPAVDTSDSVMALALDTGKVLWHNQVTPNDAYVIGCKPGADGCPQEVGPDFDFGNSPILRTLPTGKRIIVIGQKSGVAYGLDPDDRGRKLWEFRAGKGSALGGIEWGSAADNDQAYIPVSDVLLKPNEAGGLFSLKLATGEKVWHTPAPTLDCTSGRGCSAAQSAPISVMPGVVFSGSVDGHLRAYSTTDGRIIWDYNTAKDYETVNNVKAKGGSLDAAGPAIADGLVITNSGYALWKGMPGNVLLAFGKR